MLLPHSLCWRSSWLQKQNHPNDSAQASGKRLSPNNKTVLPLNPNFADPKDSVWLPLYNCKKKLNNNDKPAERKAPEFIELPVASEPLPRQARDIEPELPGNVIQRMRQ